MPTRLSCDDSDVFRKIDDSVTREKLESVQKQQCGYLGKSVQFNWFWRRSIGVDFAINTVIVMLGTQAPPPFSIVIVSARLQEELLQKQLELSEVADQTNYTLLSEYLHRTATVDGKWTKQWCELILIDSLLQRLLIRGPR